MPPELSSRHPAHLGRRCPTCSPPTLAVLRPPHCAPTSLPPLDPYQASLEYSYLCTRAPPGRGPLLLTPRSPPSPAPGIPAPGPLGTVRWPGMICTHVPRPSRQSHSHHPASVSPSPSALTAAGTVLRCAPRRCGSPLRYISLGLGLLFTCLRPPSASSTRRFEAFPKGNTRGPPTGTQHWPLQPQFPQR